MPDKIPYVQSVGWQFEVEDVFMAVAVETMGGRSQGVWRPLQHEFVSVELDPRAVAAIRADLIPDEVWRSTLRRLTHREPSSPLIAVAQAALKRPACPPDVEKEMRKAVCLTEFHNESLNSAWCRHFGAGPVLSPPLQFPPSPDYENVV
eukprot:3775117-Rhodomonas_salina.1